MYDERQQEIAERISPTAEVSHWKDWKWQLQHSIRSLKTFEKLTGIRFNESEKKAIEETIAKFPISITPYIRVRLRK
jgi:lysine 2,3-aminomutase